MSRPHSRQPGPRLSRPAHRSVSTSMVRRRLPQPCPEEFLAMDICPLCLLLGYMHRHPCIPCTFRHACDLPQSLCLMHFSRRDEEAKPDDGTGNRTPATAAFKGAAHEAQVTAAAAAPVPRQGVNHPICAYVSGLRVLALVPTRLYSPVGQVHRSWALPAASGSSVCPSPDFWASIRAYAWDGGTYARPRMLLEPSAPPSRAPPLLPPPPSV